MRTSLVLALGLLPFVFAGSAPAFSQEEKAKEKEKQEKKVVVTVETSRQAWLGVSLTDMNADMAKEKGIKADEGAYIREVVEDSPAEKAGFESGDVVVEFNGRSIYDADDLTKAVRKAEPGSTAKAIVLRKDQKKTIQVKLGKTPKNSLARSFSMGVPVAPPWPGHSMHYYTQAARMSDFSGLSMQTLNAQLAEYFEVPGGEGILVDRVKKGSAGAKAGFKAGDVILKVGEREVSEVSDVWEAVDDAGKQEKAQVEILRKGKKQTLSMEIEKREWKVRSHSGDHMEDLDIYIREAVPEMEIERNALKYHMQDLQRDLRGVGREISTKMREAQRQLREALRQVHETTL
jgi:C-terminal processing protease CtpA/Prc